MIGDANVRRGSKVQKRLKTNAGRFNGCPSALASRHLFCVRVKAMHSADLLKRLIVLTMFLMASLAEARIDRSASEVRAFRHDNPCPATHRRLGACPGWQVDHTVPLCAGGVDKRTNMSWLSTDDHKWKTFVDVRECRKLKRLALQPASEPK